MRVGGGGGLSKHFVAFVQAFGPRLQQHIRRQEQVAVCIGSLTLHHLSHVASNVNNQACGLSGSILCMYWVNDRHTVLATC